MPFLGCTAPVVAFETMGLSGETQCGPANIPRQLH